MYYACMHACVCNLIRANERARRFETRRNAARTKINVALDALGLTSTLYLSLGGVAGWREYIVL